MRKELLVFVSVVLSIMTVRDVAGQSVKGGEVQLASPSYEIQPLDHVIFRIIGEPETEKQVRVSAEGTVILPYIRNVKIAGMTVKDAQNYVYELYDGDYYIDPQIDLGVLASSIKMVVVKGYVVRPGNVQIPAEKPLYLMEALSAAGGNVPLGDPKRVEIRRTGEGGEMQEFEVNTEEITSRDYPLQEGDIITVQRRRM